MENKVNAVIDAATQTKVNAAIESLKMDLPFLIELTQGQKDQFQEMEDGRVEFVRKSFAYAAADSRLIPSYFSLVDNNKDLALCESLDAIIIGLKKVLKLLEDTRTLAGGEALAAAREIYNIAKRGAAQGVEGMQAIYDELRPFYEKHGNRPNKNNDTNK